jgi:hypothetical protein
VHPQQLKRVTSLGVIIVGRKQSAGKPEGVSWLFLFLKEQIKGIIIIIDVLVVCQVFGGPQPQVMHHPHASLCW